MAKTLIVGSDHAGLELKQDLSGVAAELGYEVVDIGTHSADSTDYPDYAHQVASAVGRGEGLGLLVLGVGKGLVSWCVAPAWACRWRPTVTAGCAPRFVATFSAPR